MFYSLYTLLSAIILGLFAELLAYYLDLPNHRQRRQIVLISTGAFVLVSLFIDIGNLSARPLPGSNHPLTLQIAHTEKDKITVIWSNLPSEGRHFLVRTDGYRYYDFEQISGLQGSRTLFKDPHMLAVAIVKLTGPVPSAGSKDKNDPSVFLVAWEPINS